MNAFCASVNFEAFIVFRSSQPEKNTAENSNSECSNYSGAEHAGQGIALVRQSLAAPDLRAGRLVRLGDRSITDVHAHLIVWRGDNPKQDMIAAMRDWLRLEAMGFSAAASDCRSAPEPIFRFGQF